MASTATYLYMCIRGTVIWGVINSILIGLKSLSMGVNSRMKCSKIYMSQEVIGPWENPNCPYRRPGLYSQHPHVGWQQLFLTPVPVDLMPFSNLHIDCTTQVYLNSQKITNNKILKRNVQKHNKISRTRKWKIRQ